MDVNEINKVCLKCYYKDKCPQDATVKIIQCNNFKNIELQRNLINIKSSKHLNKALN